MTSERGSALLGLPVRSSGVRLGTVSAVWVGGDCAVVGLEVTSAWDGGTQFLPAHAAALEGGAVTASALTFLSASDSSFYERSGAQRITLPPATRGFEHERSG